MLNVCKHNYETFGLKLPPLEKLAGKEQPQYNCVIGLTELSMFSTGYFLSAVIIELPSKNSNKTKTMSSGINLNHNKAN